MNKDEALNKFTFMMEYRNLSSNTISMYQCYLSQIGITSRKRTYKIDKF